MYPAVEQIFGREQRPCRLWIPIESSVQQHYADRRAPHRQLEFPYWTRVWSAARVMATWIEDHPIYFENKVVLELGAGIGLPSFIAQRYAKQVLVSDYLPEAVEWLRRNAETVGANLSCRLIDWRINAPLPKHDVLLLSDLFYDPGQHARLQTLLEEAYQSGKTIILATPDRAGSIAFIQQIRIPYTVSATFDCSDHGYESTVLLQLYHQAIP